MSPLSGPVIGGATVVASPALLGALDGTMPINVALTRYLIAVAICWALISLVVEFAFPSPGSVKILHEEANQPIPVEQDDEDVA